jgi:hypothetical protein
MRIRLSEYAPMTHSVTRNPEAYADPGRPIKHW